MPEGGPLPLQLFGFWRSQATFRVRVALNLKGIAYHETPVDIDSDAIDDPEFRALNPMGAVPALIVDGTALTQSMAILEYLEEAHPEPPLLPRDPVGRARVRGLAAIAVADSHPLIVPRIRRYLTEAARFDAGQWRAWQHRWFSAGLAGYEARLANAPETGTYCHGETPGFADICLCGHVAGAKTFEVPLGDYPTVMRIVDHCMAAPAFERARAIHQADYPG
ncbi:MAG: maleylacetoacetate isomerase [Caulobacteraceae bacterium]|nr:maleylacetoacetate isomerase [Caulobacter sp.]